jgi:hypothetical protein
MVLRMSIIPPHWTKVEMVSTSEVTRETSDPRRSVFCVSMDRSWICRKAVVRSVFSPASDARKSRTLTK